MSHLEFENVHVYYPVLQDHYMSLRRTLVRALSGGRLYRQDANTKLVHAINNISFVAKDGDRIGLIGRNGAGKSTLLKTIGGFILPDHGEVRVQGRVTSLFSVNGGMDHERSGYDNIYLMGRLLGMPHNEMKRHIKDIEEFSELGQFLDMPVRAYSEGMKVRLGVAVVTCLDPDILILDEAIGAGDAHFIEKATTRAKQLYEKANIIFMASHDTSILKSLCNKAIWLDKGVIVKTGDVADVIQAYELATV